MSVIAGLAINSPIESFKKLVPLAMAAPLIADAIWPAKERETRLSYTTGKEPVLAFCAPRRAKVRRAADKPMSFGDFKSSAKTAAE